MEAPKKEGIKRLGTKEEDTCTDVDVVGSFRERKITRGSEKF